MRARPGDIAAAVCIGAFLALTGLVAAGDLTGVDRYAVSHLMPGSQPSTGSHLITGGLFKPEVHSSVGDTLIGLWVYPASVFISFLVVAACVLVLRRRGRLRASFFVAALWLAVNLIEVIGKETVERPPIGLAGLRESYPSGHTLRACVVAAALGWTWRRAGPFGAAWALTVPIGLVVLGDHTPSDVVGGLLLGAGLIAWTASRLEA